MSNFKHPSLLVVALGAAAILPAAPVVAANIATWNVDAATNSGNVVPLTATSGADAGTAYGNPLGMSGYTNANGLNTSAGILCDILLTPGASTGTASNAWRIRNATTNGWAQSPAVQAGGAPQYTQGVEFDASTVGFSGITATFDWFSTTQGVKDMQEQYTTDGVNWININGLQIATSNGWSNGVAIDLTGVAAAENNPHFGLRLVSAYDPTITATDEYGAASGGAYNNSSGNWRFDNISISGTPMSAPEPTSLALLAIGVFALGVRRGVYR